MNPAHLTHKIALRPSVNAAQGRSPDVPYFPEGHVAAPPFLIVNPLSHGPDSFPGNGSTNELLGPATADWEVPKDSDEQGVGVPGFKAWPRQFHSEAYNFDGLRIMPLPDQVGPLADELINRPEKAGWSVPKYAEQYEQPVAAGGMGTGVANIRDPASVAFAIGWGYIG